eukprot:11163987-Lingulodinium_polyedra.AAC.1
MASRAGPPLLPAQPNYHDVVIPDPLAAAAIWRANATLAHGAFLHLPGANIRAWARRKLQTAVNWRQATCRRA